MENTESLSLISSMIRLSKASVMYGWFFSFVPSVSVQVRLNCPEILERRHYRVSLVEVGMIIEKDFSDFLQQFHCFGTCFYSSAVMFSKMWHNGNSSWKQLRIVSLYCL